MFRTNHRSPAPFLNPAANYFVRIGVVLTLIVAALAFAVRTQAQQVPAPTISIRPVLGALITLGSQHDVMKDGVVVGAVRTSLIANWARARGKSRKDGVSPPPLDRARRHRERVRTVRGARSVDHAD